ncbi:MAG: hypothetical protein DWQ01_18415 [Planctomycetota bacterium]|nr:MAG: hypothetical protein DWQ01_18415 [Planctomycetota bacterium]
MTDKKAVRKSARTQGLLFGWSIGALEAGFVLSARPTLARDPAIILGMVSAPMLVYGLLGVLLGLVAGKLLSRYPLLWWLGYPLGLAVLLRGHHDIPVGMNPLYLVLGCAVALSCAAFVLFPKLPAHRFVLPGKILVAAMVIAASLLWTVFRENGIVRTPLSSEAAPPDSPNVVLVTWDTVRGDTLPISGGQGLDTPNLDALAEEGVVLTNVQAVAPITAPSHMSVLTGLFPPNHGVRSNGDSLIAFSAPNLAVTLSERGYACGGFVSAYNLRSRFGFHRGFHHYDDRRPTRPHEAAIGFLYYATFWGHRFIPKTWLFSNISRKGPDTTARALEWLQDTDRPIFLWLHLYDAHGPFAPDEPYRSRALARAHEGASAVSPASQQDMVLQRGEIEFLDDLLGELLEGLEQKDPGLTNTIVTLVSDHGECFGEGGIETSHYQSLFQATQKVAAVIKPHQEWDLSASQRKIDHSVSHVDLFPTLCTILGLDLPADIDGRDLVPLLEGEKIEPRPLFMEAYQHSLLDDRLQGVMEGRWQYVRSKDGREFLYDLESEDNTLNRLADYPDIHRRLSRTLDQLLNQMRNLGQDPGASETKTQVALDQLGYGETE